MKTDSNKPSEQLVVRVGNEGMNVSPPAPVNVRPSTPPPAPPKAPSR
jgi:hypothetical protein